MRQQHHEDTTDQYPLNKDPEKSTNPVTKSIQQDCRVKDLYIKVNCISV